MVLPKYLRVADVAEQTGYTEAAIREAIAAGELSASRPKPHSPWRVKEADVVEWIERDKNSPPLHPVDALQARAG